MGYPKCTQEAIDQAVACKKNGMSNKDIAAYIGIDERTFYKWKNEPKSDSQRQLGQSLKEAESEFKAALRSKVIKASDRDWKAAAWTLERMYPDEYARPEVQFAKQAAQDAVSQTVETMRDVFVKVREASDAG